SCSVEPVAATRQSKTLETRVDCGSYNHVYVAGVSAETSPLLGDNGTPFASFNNL
ncbi:MAG: hypothetical protein ACI9HK_000916, partial [Pirellulaceae bacterium]